MRKISFAVIVLSIIMTGCFSLFDPFGKATKNHDVNFFNGTTSELYVSFSANSRAGSKGLELVRKDSSFVLPVGDSFSIIEDSYDPDGTEPAYAYYHELEEIEERILRFEVYRIIDSDTSWANLNLLNEDRWQQYDNDPITGGSTFHTYRFSLLDTDF